MIRRRYLLSLLFTGILFQTLPGQGNIRFAVHVDPQFAWLRSSDHKEIDPDGAIFHMQAGLQMDYFFADNYAFILGFGINNMGGKLVFGDSIGYGTEKDPVIVVPEQRIKMNLQYLDIPLGLKLKTEEMGYLTGFLQLGFNPMFNINAHITSRDDDAFDKENIQEEGVKLFNLGYHVGAGAEYRLGGNTALVGGIRWTSGFTKVTNGGPSLNTNALAIHLGMLF
jgi:hypothetical protein